MKRLELDGKWVFHEVGRGKWFDAVVPGSNVADLVRADIIPHPYYDDNEQLLQWIGERDWEYVREFTLSKDMLKQPVIMLDCEGIDTLADIYINDKLVAKTDNAFVHYTFDIKNFVNRLTNKIRIKLRSPVSYIERMQENTPLIGNKMGYAGASFLRKPSTHFGWDNAPRMILSGITGSVSIVAYEEVRLGRVVTSQEFIEGFANINCDAEIIGSFVEESDYRLVMTVVEPNRNVIKHTITKVGDNNAMLATINNPILWQTHDRLDEGEKPALYSVTVELFKDGEVIDTKTFRVGLHKLVLMRGKDNVGRKFEFVLNGEAINIKGATLTLGDMINPTFNTDRATKLLDAVVDANMNAVRVFAGDGYQRNEFYDLCDERGILVWQDMPFSSYEYPVANKEFKQSVAKEIACQIENLHTHPSICVLCGGYEIEHRARWWRLMGKNVKEMGKFFYEFIPKELAKYPNTVNYLPNAPISNKFLDSVNNDKYGVTSLWGIWRGMRSMKMVNKRTPAFCLEFGMPSMPSSKTIELFSEKKKVQDIYSEMLESHQKMTGGISRMLYYISQRFIVPRSIDDLVYYSQLTQAEYYKAQCENLRIKNAKCSGYFLSTANECWPGVDYSSIDYMGNYKAVMYKAKQFNAPVIVSLQNTGGKVKVYVVNDLNEEIVGSINWYIETFDGDKVAIGEQDCVAVASSASKVATLDLREYIKTSDNDRLLVVELLDEDGDIVNREIKLFVTDKKANLPDPRLSFDVSVKRGVANITVKCEKFARFVKVTMDDTYEPFNDNYFDMLAGEECVITIPVGRQKADVVKKHITVKSSVNVERKGNMVRDFATNVGVILSLNNIKDTVRHLLMK